MSHSPAVGGINFSNDSSVGFPGTTKSYKPDKWIEKQEIAKKYTIKLLNKPSPLTKTLLSPIQENEADERSRTQINGGNMVVPTSTLTANNSLAKIPNNKNFQKDIMQNTQEYLQKMAQTV